MVPAEDNVKHRSDMRKVMHVFSHDLRNPLLNIQALVQEAGTLIEEAKEARFLERKQTLSDILDVELPEALDLLKSSANRMDDMVLGVNEIYHCMFDELECEPIDMHQMFLRCFALLKLSDEDLELSSSGMPMVNADPLAVQRIVNEIFNNAQKAIHIGLEKGIRLIEVSGFVEGGFVHFQVKDSGCGFDQHEVANVFDPFFAGHSFGNGIGMGLTRAKAWVEHHGGFIHVSNEEDKGAVVTFSLPKL